MNRPTGTIEEMPPVVPSPNQLPFFEELATPTTTRARRPHLRIQPPLLADLTARQRKAVTHGEGPLLIVAGAGTGKTTVITRRIAWLIAEKRAKPSEILALTFTDRPPIEMVERVDRLVPYGHNDAQISTFHAFGDRLLRDHAFEAGLRDRSTVLGRAEQVDLPARAPLRAATGPIPPARRPDPLPVALVTLISRAAGRGRQPGPSTPSARPAPGRGGRGHPERRGAGRDGRQPGRAGGDVRRLRAS